MSKVKFAPLTRETAVGGVALSGFLISAFSLLALMSPDVFVDSPLPFTLYLTYYYTLRSLVPVIGGAYGVDAGIYFALLLISFGILRRKQGTRESLLQTAWLGALVVLVFEVSLYLVAPQWRDVFVIYAQIGTPLQWFTNDDLLVASALSLGLAQLMLSKSKRNR